MEKLPKSKWLFLRGLGRESAHWGDFEQIFSQRLNAQVISLDLPGTGKNLKEKSPCKISEIVEILRHSFANYQSSSEPTYILALSLGGMVAADWILRYSADFQGAVLINTSFSNFSLPMDRLTTHATWTLGRTLFAKSAFEREKIILSITSNLKKEDEHTLHSWAKIHEERPVSTTTILRQLAAAATWKASLNRPLIPTLLLGCDNDRLVSPSCSKVISEKWNVPLVSHPSAGHELPLDDGPWVAEAVAKWLGTL